MKHRLMTAVVIALLAASAEAQAVRTWVSTTGSDTNPCTRTAPCRNFAAAITAVDPGGEVVVLESGGYGAVTVLESVTLISPAGVHAAIAPTASAAITVNAGNNDVVVLRGLYLNSQGAIIGVDFVNGQALHVESLVVNGFDDGLRFLDSAALMVKDTVVRNNSEVGISIAGGPSGQAFASLDRIRVESNGAGLSAGFDSRVTVRDSVLSRNGFGVSVGGGGGSDAADVNIESSVVSNNSVKGVAVDGFAQVLLANVMVTNNDVGLNTNSPDSVIRVSASAISGNAVGVQVDAGSILSFANNVLDGNAAGETFTAPTIGLE